jgi:signal transduction histidine kinase
MTVVSTTRATNRRALLVFVAVLALLAGAIGAAVVVLQGQHLRATVRDEVRTGLVLLGELSQDALLRSDYAAIDRLVQAWVQRHDYLLQITARMPNGFVLSDYRKGQAAQDPLVLDQDVTFNGRPLMTLHAVGDLARRESGLTVIALQAAVATVLVIVLLGWALWGTLQRTAIQPLEAEIRQRVIQEQQLQQRSTELEAALRELEAFSYSVSHDLRAPLRAVDGYCQALIEDYAPALDGAAKQYLARTRSAAQRMGLLIDELLNLARMARQEISLTDVDLSALAREVCARLAQATPQRSVTVTVADGIHAYADGQLMEVVLENLLGNAWKYTGKTTTAHIEFRARTEAGATVCFVRDNGAGFDMQFAGKLFQPFQRLHTSAEFEGTGIGLATVARILARHGGRVWAEAERGKGATFFFSLPPRPNLAAKAARQGA